jgi:hypothetical protein
MILALVLAASFLTYCWISCSPSTLVVVDMTSAQAEVTSLDCRRVVVAAAAAARGRDVHVSIVFCWPTSEPSNCTSNC